MAINRRLFIYDFETTGFSLQYDFPTQFACKIVELDGTEHDHSTFIKCPIDIPKDIVEKTGITDEMCASGRSIEKVFKQIDEMINVPETLIIGHYILGFDNRFMDHYLDKFKHKPIDPKFCFDTCGHFKGLLLGRVRDQGDFFGTYHKGLLHKNYKGVHATLADACRYYQVPTNNDFHNAAKDVNYTYQVYKEQVKDYDNKIQIRADRLSPELKMALNKAYKRIVF